MKYIVSYGNPADGFFYVGPFDTREAAAAYMESEREQSDIWLLELFPPTEEQT